MLRYQKFIDAMTVYFHPRLLAVFGLGIASGFPLTLVTAGTLGVWLRQEELSLSTIGLFSAIGAPYALKFLWAPLIDRVKFPVLNGLVGHRRSWLFVIQFFLVIAILGLASSDPGSAPGYTALMVFLVTICSASQDIVIDAYRIEILDAPQQGAGAAMITFGYRVGNIVTGIAVLLIAERFSWGLAYGLMTFLVLFGALAAIFIGEPEVEREKLAEHDQKAVEAFLEKRAHWPENLAITIGWLAATVVTPFREFMSRRGWLVIILFVMIFKLGDALAATMTSPLLVDLNFTNDEIAFANKAVGGVALLVGVFLGGYFCYAVRMFKALLITGLFMMATNLMFAVLAATGHDITMLALTIGLENMATGMGASVMVAYLSALCNVAFTASQYALLSALIAFTRQLLSSSAGKITELLGYVDFFIFTTVAALPGLFLLFIMWRYGFATEAVRSNPENSP